MIYFGSAGIGWVVIALVWEVLSGRYFLVGSDDAL
jgi:hypothetical protein